MSRAFACGCSEASRFKAEGWMRKVLDIANNDEDFPFNLDPEYAILTGETKTLKYFDPQIREEVVSEYPARRAMDLTEDMMIVLTDEAQRQRKSASISVGYDQWCGLSVKISDWNNKDAEPTGFYIQYDWGLLPHALAAATLLLRGESLEPDGAEKEEYERLRALDEQEREEKKAIREAKIAALKESPDSSGDRADAS